MKQRCLLLLSLFLATLTGAWAQTISNYTITGNGCLGPGSTNPRAIGVSFDSDMAGAGATAYRVAIFNSANVFQNSTTIPGLVAGGNGPVNVNVSGTGTGYYARVQSSTDGITWTNLNAPSSGFDIQITPTINGYFVGGPSFYACEGSTITEFLTFDTPLNFGPYTVNYTIKGTPDRGPFTAPGTLSAGNTALSFTTQPLIDTDNGNFTINSITGAGSPPCPIGGLGTFFFINVSQYPTISAAVSAGPVCEATGSVFNLNGLIPLLTGQAPPVNIVPAVQRIKYTIDGGAEQTATVTVTSPTGTVTIPTTGLADGNHTLTITAIEKVNADNTVCKRILNTPLTTSFEVRKRPTLTIGALTSGPLCELETSNTWAATLGLSAFGTASPATSPYTILGAPAPVGISQVAGPTTAGAGTLTVTHTGTPGTKSATFTITDNNGCISDPIAHSFVINANPTFTLTPANPTICAAGQGTQSAVVTLTVTSASATGNPYPITGTWGGTAPGIGTGAISIAALNGTATATATGIGTVAPLLTDANGCTPTVAPVENVRLLTVQPSTLTPPLTAASCTQFDPAAINGSVGTSTVSGGPAATGPNYLWSRTGANDMTYAPAVPAGTGQNYDPTTLPDNMSNISEVYNYQRATSFTSANGLTTCTLDATAPAAITVYPKPRITGPKTASPSPTCSGVPFSYTPVNAYPNPGDVVPAGTTYSWPDPMPAGITGSAAGTNASSISGALTNTTNAPITVTYVVTPSTSALLGNCPGTPFNVVVTINPTPNAAASPSPQQICSATATGLTVTNPNAVVGATFKWTAVYGAVTGGAGSGGDPVMGGVAFGANAINETLSNLTPNPIVVVYTITPIGPAPTYCAGTPITVNVTVLPEPSIPSAAGGIKIVGPDNKSEACQGSGIVNLTNNATCTGANELVKWYTEAQKNDPAGPMSGLASDPTTINTATAGVTKWYVACRNQVNGCETAISRRVEVIFTVNPAPTRPDPITLTPNQICEGSPTPSVAMANNADAMCVAANSAGFTAVWYTSPGDVILAGGGAAPTMTPTTTTTWRVRCKNPVTGCISLLTGLNYRLVTFTVNPAPAAPAVFGADAPNAQFYPKEACQGLPGSLIALDPTDLFTVPNTIPFNIGCTPFVETLKWYQADGTTPLSFAGNGNVAGASPTSLPTGVAGLQTYKVACVRTSTGCESLTKTTITFMVNPAPAAPTVALTPTTACASTPAGAPMTNNATCNGLTPGGESPVWYDNSGVPLAGAPAVTPAVTTTYQVRCKNTTTNCISLTFTAVTFTVFPTPTINPIAPPTATYCNNAPVSAVALSGTPAAAIAPNSAVWFKYSGGASIGLANGTTSTQLPAFTATNAGTTVVTANIMITPYTFGPNGTNDGGTGDDCLGAPFTYAITVIPTPTVTFTCPAPVCANDAFSAIAFSSPVAGTVFNWTNDNTTIGLVGAGMGNIASFTGLNASTTMSNIGLLTVTPSVTVNSVTCVGPDVTCNLRVKPRPSSNLTASQTDVCPNTEVTLNPNCSIPTPISTVQWGNGVGSALPAPAGPTVTPTAPDLTYIYTAICSAEGCAGDMTSATVRTHRLLVDIVKVAHPSGNVNQPGPIVEVQNDLGKDLSVPKNTITNNDPTRTWNIIARPCYAPVGSISFEFTAGPLPLSYKTVDNFAPHAFFANDNATSFYSQASMAYGPGSTPPYSTGGTAVFPNGTYTILVEGRTNAVSGSIPAARNKLSGGALLSTRSITFKVQGSTPGARMGVDETVEEAVDAENWISLVQNPISEEIMLRLSGKVGDDIQLNLVNLQGQEVHQSSVKLASRSELSTINVRSFNTGFYILKAVNGDKVKTIKVLKVQE